MDNNQARQTPRIALVKRGKLLNPIRNATEDILNMGDLVRPEARCLSSISLFVGWSVVEHYLKRRRFLMMVVTIAVGILVVASPTWADDLGPNKGELIHSLLPTVVNILVRKDDPASAPVAAADAAVSGKPSTDIKSYVGSGFVIDTSGLIVTNYHVVQDAFEITVTFSDGTRLSGKTLSASRLADLALVQVEAGHPLPAAHWGDSDKLQVGDQVFAAGNPFGIGLSVSAGIVSGLNRDIQDSPYDDFIQTDATINHGNSGGPLFDMQGNVVGVNSTIISPTKGSVGLGFAIPESSARFVVHQLRTYGWVRPGWIGIKIQQVTRDIADAMGLPASGGSIVSWVLPDGPAKAAGIAIGDVILRYDGSIPSDDRALLREIASTPVGQTITLAVARGGHERDIPLKVEAWPRNQWDAKDAPQKVLRPTITIPPNLGLSLSEIAVGDREKRGLEDGLSGVLVTGVAANSDPSSRGMVNGDIILRVQNKPVKTPDEVQAGIAAARAEHRDYVLMLVLPKVRTLPGPKWIALEVTRSAG